VFWVSGFRFRVSGFGFRVSGVRDVEEAVDQVAELKRAAWAARAAKAPGHPLALLKQRLTLERHRDHLDCDVPIRVLGLGSGLMSLRLRVWD